MNTRTLSDRALLHAVAALVARDRATTTELLEHLAEVDTRRLYLAAGHPSMFAYCIEALHMSESSASKRIRVARAARSFPALFAAIADGRLHLSAVCVLAPHLRPDNVEELIGAATHLRRDQVESWVGVRFAPPLLRPAAAGGRLPEPVQPAQPGAQLPLADSGSSGIPPAEHSPGNVDNSAAGAAGAAGAADAAGGLDFASAPAVRPHFVLHVALSPATHAKLHRAQRLLSHALPAGDVAALLDRALDVLIERFERRKLAATTRPRPARTTPRPLAPRTIPAAVKRAVVARDGERCAFVAPGGRRCSARSRLEFDHVDPVARGGGASPDRVRLLCRAHNQFAAERVFGTEFMRSKRARPSTPGPKPEPEPQAAAALTPALPDPPA